MSERLEMILMSTEPQLWVVRQAVVFEWYDGPRQGLCELESPRCTFYFEIVAERWWQKNFDDRLFRLSGVESDSVARAISALQPEGPPTTPVWAPHGEYRSNDHRQVVEKVVDEIMASRVPSRLLVRSRDMTHFSEVWLETHPTEPDAG